ncbi:hypothetical protein A3F64_03215 [Candidatus Saccharibacteria bacterium RIFCSPHIGHO2_12_FULL_42_8]|nr:MAG: hypothetical protein A3F64_03215 [Candidatus Saccharibacteria bacterium RIFCSPHIGHO2_12_FULL_42_8]
MNKKLLNIIQTVLTIALIVFIVLKAGDFFKHVDWSSVASSWPAILLSGTLFVCGYLILAWHWMYVCRMIDAKASDKQWLAFLASQPYKYLPTSLFTFSSRAMFASKFGMSLKQSSEAQIIENLNLIGSALVTGGLLLLLNYNFFIGLLAAMIIATTCLLIWNQRSIKIPKVNLKLDLTKWFKSLAIVTLGWSIVGFAFFVMVIGLEGRVELILSIAASNLATGLGILAVFAPGGIGVRELVFHYLAFASSTILIWRLTTFVVDIVFGTWASWAISRSRR